MRLFVGVWPSAEVRAALAALPHPDGAGARWTPPEQWHVTLRFLGEVDDPAPWEALIATLGASSPARTVTLGPATTILGRDNLVVPAAGLDDLAAAVGAEQPYRAHLTLARRAPRRLAGTPFTASWDVTHVALIRSHLGGAPARYETIASAALRE